MHKYKCKTTTTHMQDAIKVVVCMCYSFRPHKAQRTTKETKEKKHTHTKFTSRRSDSKQFVLRASLRTTNTVWLFAFFRISSGLIRNACWSARITSTWNYFDEIVDCSHIGNEIVRGNSPEIISIPLNGFLCVWLCVLLVFLLLWSMYKIRFSSALEFTLISSPIFPLRSAEQQNEATTKQKKKLRFKNYHTRCMHTHITQINAKCEKQLNYNVKMRQVHKWFFVVFVSPKWLAFFSWFFYSQRFADVKSNKIVV